MRKLVMLLAVWLLSSQVLAQTYPSKPIRLAVPFPAGADTDLTARVVAGWLEKRLRQPVIVENRPGGGQIVATDYMIKSPPDGHTLLFAAMTVGYLDVVIKATPFIPLRDLQTIAMVAGSGFALVVHPDFPARTMAELVAWVKANPGKLNWGNAGPFPVPEIADLKIRQGLDWVNVPHAGGAPAFTAVMSGTVHAYNSSPTQALDAHRAGKVRIVAYTEPQRHPMIPDVSTMTEQGFPGFSARFWFGLWGQSALPRDIVTRLNAEILEMFKDPESAGRFQKFGYVTYPFNADQAQREFEQSSRLAAEIYKSIGAKPL